MEGLGRRDRRSRVCRRLACRGLVFCALASVVGCATTHDRPRPPSDSAPLPDPAAGTATLSTQYPVLRTQYSAPGTQYSAPGTQSSPPQPDPPDELDASAQLDLDALVRAVLDRNPSLAAMVEAWQAAAQRYPQVVSLEDPMLDLMRGTDEGWMVQVSQKLFWPGKRQLRGNVAAAEAEMACYDVQDARLRLTEAAKKAFFDYYQAERQLAVNAATSALIGEFREIAKSLYEAAKATDQDVLQAGVDLADLEARRAELVRDRKIAAARINTLLHRTADHPLPPPPAEVGIPGNPLDHAGPAVGSVGLALSGGPTWR